MHPVACVHVSVVKKESGQLQTVAVEIESFPNRR